MVEDETIVEGEEGATGEAEVEETPAAEGAEPTAEDLDEVEEEAVADDVETATYKITGLVDIFDEQMNITGQFPVGSVQELPVEYGTRMVAEGQAEAVAPEGDVIGEDEVE